MLRFRDKSDERKKNTVLRTEEPKSKQRRGKNIRQTKQINFVRSSHR